MPVSKGNNTQAIAVERQLRVLELAGAIGGWITPDLLANSLWFAKPNSMSYAYDLLAAMVGQKRLLTRPINGRGKVYVVTTAGAHFAESNGIKTTVGLRWGRQLKGQAWMPPMTFVHDLRAARFLVFVSNAGLKTLGSLIRGLSFDPSDEMVSQSLIAFDHEIRRLNPNAYKHPDGLVVIRGRVFWVEVEASRKDGTKDMGLLCNCLIDIAQGNCPSINVPSHLADDSCMKPTDSIVVFPTLARDTRGTMINHKKRLVSALKRTLLTQSDLIDSDDEMFVDPQSETRPLPLGMMRTYFVEEIDPGRFMMPERLTLPEIDRGIEGL